MLAVPYPNSFYEPDQGVYPGMTPPSSLESRFPDVDRLLPVYIVVYPHPLPTAPDPRTRPWALAWPLAMSNDLVPALLTDREHDFTPLAVPVSAWTPALTPRVQRVVAVARVLEAAQAPARDHFTFWGALTCAWTRPDLLGAHWVLLGVLDRPRRRALERLAARVRAVSVSFARADRRTA
jgi:hypothetical protein